MKQVKITNIHNQEFGGQFESEAEMQAWIDDCIAKDVWGKKEHTLTELVEKSPAKEAELDEEGNEISPAIEAEFEEVHTLVPAEYEIVIEDISAEVEQEKINAEALSFLNSTDFKVLRHLRQKALGQELSLSEEEYLALEQERSDAAARIVR
jgi:hypothetical protein